MSCDGSLSADASHVVEVGGFRLEWSRGRAITVANAGLRPADGTAAPGFEVCTFCGYAGETRPTPEVEPDPEDIDEVGHKAYCPARKDPRSELVKKPVWLTAALQGDVIELILPPAARGQGFAGWRATLAEALLLGVGETMQAGRRDLDWFERRQVDEPRSLVLFDTMPGGTGYVPKLFAERAVGLKQAAREAIRRLEARAPTRATGVSGISGTSVTTSALTASKYWVRCGGSPNSM